MSVATLRTLRDGLEESLTHAATLKDSQPEGRTRDLVDAIHRDLSMRLDDLDRAIIALAKWGDQ